MMRLIATLAAILVSHAGAAADGPRGWVGLYRGAQAGLVVGLVGDAIASPPSDQRPSRLYASLRSSAPGEIGDLKGIDQHVAEWLRTCLADWDQDTHLTRDEWRASCRRVAEDRKHFLFDHLGASSIGTGLSPR